MQFDNKEQVYSPDRYIRKSDVYVYYSHRQVPVYENGSRFSPSRNTIVGGMILSSLYHHTSTIHTQVSFKTSTKFFISLTANEVVIDHSTRVAAGFHKSCDTLVGGMIFGSLVIITKHSRQVHSSLFPDSKHFIGCVLQYNDLPQLKMFLFNETVGLKFHNHILNLNIGFGL